MPDKDTDRGDNEFWCGMSTCPGAEDDIVTMDEIDLSRDPGELPAPWSWIQTVIRKVRTFGRQ